MAPFYGWDSTASRQHNHYEETVYVFTNQPPRVCGTYLMDLGRMKR